MVQDVERTHKPYKKSILPTIFGHGCEAWCLRRWKYCREQQWCLSLGHFYLSFYSAQVPLSGFQGWSFQKQGHSSIDFGERMYVGQVNAWSRAGKPLIVKWPMHTSFSWGKLVPLPISAGYLLAWISPLADECALSRKKLHRSPVISYNGWQLRQQPRKKFCYLYFWLRFHYIKWWPPASYSSFGALFLWPAALHCLKWHTIFLIGQGNSWLLRAYSIKLVWSPIRAWSSVAYLFILSLSFLSLCSIVPICSFQSLWGSLFWGLMLQHDAGFSWVICSYPLWPYHGSFSTNKS